MIKYILVFFVIFSSCKKAEELATFNINKSEKFTIPATVLPVGTALPLGLESPPTNTSTEFKNNRSETKYAKDVKLTKLSFEITNPPTANFNFLKSVKIFISSPSVAGEKLLAYNDDVPRGVSSFELTTSGDKLDEYIKADSYSLRVETIIRETVPQNTDVTSNMTFRVTAKIL
ncbi:MAG TPA: hypothetical protein VF691_14580 [Cytophagaceae bacterium]|jgi:hypothetical protein